MNSEELKRHMASDAFLLLTPDECIHALIALAPWAVLFAEGLPK